MSQFLVPQFIDVEPHVIGPITVRQFIISLVGVMFIFVAYKLLDFVSFVAVAVLVFAIFGTLAFLKINGRPFHYFLLNLIETFRRPGLRVWDKTLTLTEVRQLAQPESTIAIGTAVPYKRRLSASHLEELALVVNTGGRYQSPYGQE